MKKKLTVFGLGIIALGLASCGGKGGSSPASIAQKWCDLNAKVHNAADDASKEAAKEAREKYEKEMQEKYKNDDAFMKKVGEEVEKCEDASEGRK